MFQVRSSQILETTLSCEPLENTIRFKMSNYNIRLNEAIIVTGPLLILIVWELITDYRYRLRNSRNLFSYLIMGLLLPTFIFSELITMTITVTDADLNCPELDWNSFRYKR